MVGRGEAGTEELHEILPELERFGQAILTEGHPKRLGGGGGSGGTLMVQAPNNAGSLGGSAIGGPGGSPGGTNPGGGGANGRVRFDVSGASGPPTNPPVGFLGPVIDPNWETAWQHAPTQVPIICGLGAQFVLEVDGSTVSSLQVCTGSANTATLFVAPGTLSSGLHRVCTRVAMGGPRLATLPFTGRRETGDQILFL